MGFVGSTKYYILCGISLIALLTGLAILIRQSSSAAKSKHPHKVPPSERVPKYAAGDEMDRINRNAYIAPRRKKSIVSLLLGVIVLAGTVFLYTKSKVPAPVSNNLPIIDQTYNKKSETIATQEKKLKTEIKSAEYSQDLSKIFVTLVLSNETDITFYAISPTLNLKSDDNGILQSEVADIIAQIEPNDMKEITKEITILPENIGKIAHVEYHVQYYKQKP